MAECTMLNTLMEGTSAAFGLNGEPCRDGLGNVLNGLIELLADPEELDIETVDMVWQATRTLQASLATEGELDAEMLATLYAQLTGSASGDSLPPSETASEPPIDSTVEEEPYVIPPDDIPLIEDFIQESVEHLESAESAMLALEANMEDSDALNLIFRSVHTIKGMAGFMNLDQISLLTHNAETLLDLARKGDLLLDGNNAEAIFKSLDTLKLMVESLRNAISNDGLVPPHPGVAELAGYLRQCASSEPPSTSLATAAESKTESAAPLALVAASGTESVAPLPPPSPATPPLVEAETTKNIPSQPSSKKNTAQIDEKIKVSTGRLDSLVNMVGELVIAQLMVSESLRSSALSDNELLRNTAHQGKIIRELQELSMSMRMVPISGIFQKMARMTRDLSKKAGKAVELEMEGEQTELDRTIVDKLADPLVHMIRNSVDHGIESADERTAAGKPPHGTITLKAYHSAGNIVIEIIDDGRGLNREKLLEKAISRGAIAADKNPTDQEIFSTIFLPGLSTAAAITSISGRGVGMDVVRRNIEELRGRIDIASTPGKGTLFTVTLPLTLAVIDGQMVRIGNEKYIIPINNIRRSFRPDPDQISTVHDRREMVMVRDELLPLVRLYELFDIEPDFKGPSEGLVVIVEEDNEACCLFVDDLLDQQQVVIKSLGPALGHTEGVSGGAIMGDGMVRLILDIPGVIKLFRA